MAPAKKVSKAAKESVSKVISQAKESLKLLENAKSFVKLPSNAKANDKILASLKKVGVATQDEVEALRLRVEKLEAQLITHFEKHEGKSAAESQPQH